MKPFGHVLCNLKLSRSDESNVPTCLYISLMLKHERSDMKENDERLVCKSCPRKYVEEDGLFPNGEKQIRCPKQSRPAGYSFSYSSSKTLSGRKDFQMSLTGLEGVVVCMYHSSVSPSCPFFLSLKKERKKKKRKKESCRSKDKNRGGDVSSMEFILASSL